jgi:L-cysteine desulfidase
MNNALLNENQLLDIIEKMTFKTIGCTEPMAIALAAVVAYKELGGEISEVVVSLDKNVYKNAMAVGIPGTTEKGPKIAIALGLICGDPTKGLLLLEKVTDDDVACAKELLAADKIKITLNEEATSLCIEAKVTTANGKARALIHQCHDNIVLIEKDGQTIFHRITNQQAQEFLCEYDFSNVQLCNLITTVKKIPLEKISYLNEAYLLNKQAAEVGLETSPGMALGATFQKLIAENLLENSFTNQVKMMVSAASDARMGGIKIPVFGCAGSGNHGIIFFLTIGMSLEHFKITEPAAPYIYAFGLVILAIIKKNLGLLSSSCGGAIAAGAAAAAAITWALGGTIPQINHALCLVIGNIAGMICDGAKFDCALKISTGATLAIDSTLLALHGVKIPNTDGIIGCNFNETMHNLHLLSKTGMAKVDDSILEMLKCKMQQKIL